MKRIILALTMLVAMVATASAQAEIKFEKVVHNFGTFRRDRSCAEGSIHLHQCG